MLKTYQQAYLLFDLLRVDNALKQVTVVTCPPFCDENVAALLSLLLNKHRQNRRKGYRHLFKCRSYSSDSKKT